MDERAAAMIKAETGKYTLSGRHGEWTYKQIDSTSGEVSEGGVVVGSFQYTPIGEDQQPALAGLFKWDAELAPTKEMRCIGVTNGEIMQDIQLPENEGAYFILPSQLNGAEYPSETSIVRSIQEYVYDNTGGPRGQLAVHPATGSFVLANAANQKQLDGICAIDEVLIQTDAIRLMNGYMALPSLQDDEVKAKRVFEIFTGALHTLRPLIMHDVPATGLVPSKREWSAATHKVGLVYASAVPVDSYLNCARSKTEHKLHKKMAEAVLVAQYYGAMRQIAQRAQAGAKTRVYMLPLGGGVFNNPMDSIARAMAQAAELLAADDPALFNRVELQALAWNGNPAEKKTLERELETCAKFLREDGERFEVPMRDPPPPAQTAPAAVGGTAASEAPPPPPTETKTAGEKPPEASFSV